LPGTSPAFRGCILSIPRRHGTMFYMALWLLGVPVGLVALLWMLGIFS
jgi:hypothetical protein